MKRLSYLVATALAATLCLGSPAARACSYEATDPWEHLQEADGAIVGTVQSRKTRSTAGPYRKADWTFRVERSVKGDLAGTIVVESNADGASCGLSLRVGERVGLFLYRSSGRWTSGLGSTLSPSALLRLVARPSIESAGPAVLVVAGSFGRARLVSLDAGGRIVSYAEGPSDSDSFDVSVCPGSERLVEYVVESGSDPPVQFLAVRDAASMRVVRTIPISSFAGARQGMRETSCRDRSANDLIVALQGEPAATVVRLKAGHHETLYRGDLGDATFGSTAGYIAQGTNLLRLDLDRGRTRYLAKIPAGASRLALSPDERSVAVASDGWQSNEVGRLVVVDVARGRRVETRTDPNRGGLALWLDNRRVAVVPQFAAGQELLVFNRQLRRVGRWSGWAAHDVAVAGGRLFAVQSGVLQSARALGGPARELRTFDTPETYALIPLPPRPPPPKPAMTTVEPPFRFRAPEAQDWVALPDGAPTRTEGPPTRRAVPLAVATILVLLTATLALRWRGLRRVDG